MELLIVRHGIAEDVARSDSERSLTREGKEHMQRAASRLRELLPTLDLVMVSPLLRAIQTGEIISSVFGITDFIESEGLLSECPPDETLREIARYSNSLKTVCCVGHEPNLSTLISLCITGKSIPIVRMGKGGASLLRFPGTPEPGRGTLLWHAPNSLLRK